LRTSSSDILGVIIGDQDLVIEYGQNRLK
jgi:hypothetical protein